jgi:hypothetical protein
MKISITSLALLSVLVCSSTEAFAPSPSSKSGLAHYTAATTTATATNTYHHHHHHASALHQLHMSSSEPSTNSNSGPFDFLTGLFSNKNDNNKAVKQEEKPKLPDVVIDSDYNIAYAFGAVGILIVLVTQGSVFGAVVGGITLLFASFLAIQAKRIKFVFDEDSFELKMGDSPDELTSSGENIVVGGENRWKYDSFVNYDFFPNRGLPILVYFKENQTPEEKWNEGPGGLDKVGGGQLHFFPAIGNVDQLKEQFALRGCAKIED